MVLSLCLRRPPTAAAAAGAEPGSAVEIQRWANQDDERDDMGGVTDEGHGGQGGKGGGTSKAPKQRAHIKRERRKDRS